MEYTHNRKPVADGVTLCPVADDEQSATETAKRIRTDEASPAIERQFGGLHGSGR